MLTEKLRELIAILSTEQSWLDKFSGTSTYVGGSTKNIAMYKEAVVNFSK